MWIWLGGIGLLIALLLAAVLISYVHVHFTFSKQNHDDYAKITIRMFYGIVRINYEIPSIVFRNWKEGFLVKTEQRTNHSRGESQGSKRVNKRKVEKWAKDVKIMLRATDALKQWVKQTLTRVHMTHMSWSTRVGVGDAAYTAILIGWVWSIKSSIIGYLSYQIHFERTPVLQVVPVWGDDMEFQTELDWKMKIRITALLIAGFMLLTRVLQVEGGWRVWFKLLQEQRRRRKKKLKRHHTN
ncbi:DUF2953 domain-containing protein [Paenibacillus sp. JNUCC31]|uniref:DUF2953 domain-containing protein n=1 Tax=Paenibacillus sp. JNUCC-31 TaxID=2777983 RepID=UPI001784BC49|nr:DUF2953 domain-containing protein [Paenibacillus sp. JNUCC-31]QOS79943.1 DUF2953 domain-containing protein [Paenibacillus sp. JNUCC-31]